MVDLPPCLTRCLSLHVACFTLKGIWDTEFVERELPDLSKLGPDQ